MFNVQVLCSEADAASNFTAVRFSLKSFRVLATSEKDLSKGGCDF